MGYASVAALAIVDFLDKLDARISVYACALHGIQGVIYLNLICFVFILGTLSFSKFLLQVSIYTFDDYLFKNDDFI